jgi:peroxiredoxin/predicted methyltransferase
MLELTSLLFLFVGCGSSSPTVEAPEPAEGPQPAQATAPRQPLAIGTRAPDVLAPDQSGALRTISEHRGRAVVLYFYPRDATPGCTAEACAFRDAWSRIEGAGATVYGVSTDDVDAHRAFAEEHELPFSLLSDPDEEILADYGVPSRDGAAARLTFLIDRSGAVARVFEEVDPALHADEVVAAIEALPEGEVDRARIHDVVTADDRSDVDRSLDEGRHPEETFAFFGIAEGMKVAELFAGTGYTAELLARIVGARGRVYGQNNQFVIERFAEAPWSARLDEDVMSNVTRVDREMDDPLPDDVTDLDAVIFILAYHDTVWMETDRSAMNRGIFESLRPGGIYGIVDHAAAEGRGVDDVRTLHRIEREVVVREVEGAGFELFDEARFLVNPDDAHDWSASPGQAGERRGTSDRFVLLFRKPGG